ncbi:hypothetical protein TNCV_3112371 [Trichonephila clavipes]|nr:hypothetical protein TNCV_3112371 [Trichonephila clavipes]
MAKGWNVRLSLAVALSTIRGQYDLARFHPNLEGEYPRSDQGPATSLPHPPTSREDLRLDGYLEYPHAMKMSYQMSDYTLCVNVN